MLAEGLDAASAAFEVGYESASQFNREYKRFFGQPAMRDVKVRRLAGSAMVSDQQPCRSFCSDVGNPEINHRYRTGRPILQRQFLEVYCVRFAHSSDIFPDVDGLRGAA
jgi:hypothetical protein